MIKLWDRFTKPAIDLVVDHPDLALRITRMSNLVFGLSFVILALLAGIGCYFTFKTDYFPFFFFTALIGVYLAFRRFETWYNMRFIK